MTPNFHRIVDIGYSLLDRDITGGRTFHLSAILNKSRVISIGINNYLKSHPRNKEFGYAPHARLHAEMAACLRLGFTDCSGLSIVNLRIDRNGNLCNSKFCLGCSNLIKFLNFKDAYYSTESGFESYY